MTTERTFMYFAFGSNLLKERLQLNNPSAHFHCTGRLQDFVLKFGVWGEHITSSWNGGVATIEECPGEEVWGVVWNLDMEHLDSLDNQEGVKTEVYKPLEVVVHTEDGPLSCRTYKMNNFRPVSPSPQYKQVVCLGAQQNGLPQDYVKKLLAVETNGYSGPSLLDKIEGIKT